LRSTLRPYYRKHEKLPELTGEETLSNMDLCEGSGDEFDDDVNEMINNYWDKYGEKETFYYKISCVIPGALWQGEYSEYIEVSVQRMHLTAENLFELSSADSMMEYQTGDNNILLQYTRGLKRFIISQFPRFLNKNVYGECRYLVSYLNMLNMDMPRIDLLLNQVPSILLRTLEASDDPIVFIFKYNQSQERSNISKCLQMFTTEVRRYPHNDLLLASENLIPKLVGHDNYVLFDGGGTELFDEENDGYGDWIITKNDSKYFKLKCGCYKLLELLTYLREHANRNVKYHVYFAATNLSDEIVDDFLEYGPYI
jgi:hypothetical protein